MLNIQSYVNPKIFAGVVKWIEKEGINHKGSYSFVVRLIISAVHNSMVPNDCKFNSSEEAIEYLSLKGFSMAQIKDVRAKRATEELRVESIKLEVNEEEDVSDRVKEVENLLKGM